jgi:hypothetical protein
MSRRLLVNVLGASLVADTGITRTESIPYVSTLSVLSSVAYLFLQLIFYFIFFMFNLIAATFLFSIVAAAQRGPWPSPFWGFLITHNGAAQ